MQSETTTIFTSTFEEDVYHGLTSENKYLYSKYFYDETGDKLFQDIMNLPEYYLTNAEFNILDTHKEALSEVFASKDGFDLIELGAGDGKKTKILLRHFLKKELDFQYLPIDISQNALDQLEGSLQVEIPGLTVETQQGTYFEVLERLASYKSRKKVIMMLGSNIGNLLHPKAIVFLKKIQASMNGKDLLFIGLDQKKDPQRILDAYNDATGVTAAFNLNVLKRINREMDADFDLSKFKHWEVYDPETGTAKSFLVSKESQTVNVKKIGLKVDFKAWETIHTEISQKYDDEIVNWLAKEAGLNIKSSYTDNEQQYKNYILTKD